MKLNNITGYTTSKNDTTVVLNGEYEITEKVLNGRVKCIDKDGKTVWVLENTIKELKKQERILKAMSKHTEKMLQEAETKKEPLKEIPEVVEETATDTKEPEVILHRVKRGENIHSISMMYNVTPMSIINLNGTKNPALGSLIKIIKR